MLYIFQPLHKDKMTGLKDSLLTYPDFISGLWLKVSVLWYSWDNVHPGVTIFHIRIQVLFLLDQVADIKPYLLVYLPDSCINVCLSFLQLALRESPGGA